MHFRNIFITVGTTQFDSLVEVINTIEIANVFKTFQCQKLTIQIGTGKSIDFKKSAFYKDISIELYTIKPSIMDDIQTADLIISHAGAGSCLEGLCAGKPMVVVVNELLMGNHQIELAQQLADEGYLIYCTPKTLANTLIQLDLSKLKPYEKGNPNNFVTQLNKLFNFE